MGFRDVTKAFSGVSEDHRCITWGLRRFGASSRALQRRDAGVLGEFGGSQRRYTGVMVSGAFHGVCEDFRVV